MHAHARAHTHHMHTHTCAHMFLHSLPLSGAREDNMQVTPHHVICSGVLREFRVNWSWSSQTLGFPFPLGRHVICKIYFQAV